MNGFIPEFPSSTLLELLGSSARRSSALHRQFLQVRRDGLQDMRALIELQIAAGFNAPAPARPALFTGAQLDEFGTGSISRCLGPAFARYDTRRIPRIPNGDLKMMSRIVSIEGTPRDFSRPASLVAEYDVPADAWYLGDGAYPQIPPSLYMEIALQPCGFLSAYLDTYALAPDETFFFRNLDGSARVVEAVDVRGQTITTRASLLSSVASSGTVIQKYAFELCCLGRTIYQGESIFGYFSPETMANQVGLDGGQPVPPALRADAALAQAAARVNASRWQSAAPRKPYYRLAHNRLRFLDEVALLPAGGRYGKGYLYAARPVNPRDWYFPYHFYQDPVMPGSLGVEAILEAMQVYALANDLGSGLRSPRFGPLPGGPAMTWRYRGQITQQHQLMELEVHLSVLDRQPGRVSLTGDASLWVDGLRIYEIKNASVALMEA